MTTSPSFAPLLEKFFTQRLMQQRQASMHTIASYRDTFKLLLEFVQRRLHKAPSELSLDDQDAPLITAFLDEQEHVRSVTARTRNLRLTAIHSFFPGRVHGSGVNARRDDGRSSSNPVRLKVRVTT